VGTGRKEKSLNALIRIGNIMPRTCASTATTEEAEQRRHGLALIQKSFITLKASAKTVILLSITKSESKRPLKGKHRRKKQYKKSPRRVSGESKRWRIRSSLPIAYQTLRTISTN